MGNEPAGPLRVAEPERRRAAFCMASAERRSSPRVSARAEKKNNSYRGVSDRDSYRLSFVIDARASIDRDSINCRARH